VIYLFDFIARQVFCESGWAGMDHRVGARAHVEVWSSGKRYIESFNVRLRDELLDGEIFYTLREGPDRHREPYS
jgi:hypothetical protein